MGKGRDRHTNIEGALNLQGPGRARLTALATAGSLPEGVALKVGVE